MNRLSVLVSFAALSSSILSNYGSTAQPQLGPGVNPLVVNLGIPSSIANLNLGDISFAYENDNGMMVAGNLTNLSAEEMGPLEANIELNLLMLTIKGEIGIEGLNLRGSYRSGGVQLLPSRSYNNPMVVPGPFNVTMFNVTAKNIQGTVKMDRTRRRVLSVDKLRLTPSIGSAIIQLRDGNGPVAMEPAMFDNIWSQNSGRFTEVMRRAVNSYLKSRS